MQIHATPDHGIKVDEELNIEPGDIAAAIYGNDDSSKELGDEGDESEEQGGKIHNEEVPLIKVKSWAQAQCRNVSIESRTG